MSPPSSPLLSLSTTIVMISSTLDNSQDPFRKKVTANIQSRRSGPQQHDFAYLLLHLRYAKKRILQPLTTHNPSLFFAPLPLALSKSTQSPPLT